MEYLAARFFIHRDLAARYIALHQLFGYFVTLICSFACDTDINCYLLLIISGMFWSVKNCMWKSVTLDCQGLLLKMILTINWAELPNSQLNGWQLNPWTIANFLHLVTVCYHISYIICIDTCAVLSLEFWCCHVGDLYIWNNPLQGIVYSMGGCMQTSYSAQPFITSHSIC